MSVLSQIPITDADDWPHTVKVTLSGVYSHDNGDEDDSHTTITGSATFTFTRAHLEDVLYTSRLLAYDAGFTPDTDKFLPVRGAIGRMPGWIVTFGAATTQQAAFTRKTTYHPKDGSTKDPLIEKIDGNCSPVMVCAPCAPQRFVNIGTFPASQTLVSLNNGFGVRNIDDGADSDPNYNKAVPYTVEMLRSGHAATPTSPEVGNLYRCTFPDDVATIYGKELEPGMTVVYNGQTLRVIGGGAVYGVADFGNVFAVQLRAQDPHSGVAVPCTTYPRSPYEVDVLMDKFGDVLGAGTLSYESQDGYVQLESTVQITGDPEKIDDPFQLTSVHHDGDPDNEEDGYDWDVTFT